jgi:hypothetical protein
MLAATNIPAVYGRRRVDETTPTFRAVQVDFGTRRISIDGYVVRLPRLGARRSLAVRYVDLVREVRGPNTPARFALRIADLDALGEALALPIGLVGSDVARAMERALREEHTRFGSFVIPASGMAIAASAGIGVYSQLGGVTTPLGTSAGLIRDGATSSSVAGDAPIRIVPVEVATPAALNPIEASPIEASPIEASPIEASPVPVGAAAVALDEPHHDVVGAAALELVSFDWATRLPDWTIEFSEGRPGFLGYAFFNDKRIEIYVRDEHTPQQVAATVAHELGHAIDVSTLDDAQRAVWLQVRGIDVGWWPTGETSDYGSGAGDFAEAFATWQVGEISRSTVAGQPTEAELELLAALVGG